MGVSENGLKLPKSGSFNRDNYRIMHRLLGRRVFRENHMVDMDIVIHMLDIWLIHDYYD